MVRENILRGLDLFEFLVKREQRKRDLVVRRVTGWACSGSRAVGAEQCARRVIAFRFPHTIRSSWRRSVSSCS